jgi:3'-phosphoadenosine 5'-phosphosulfate sulfotransferase (PAPS reductase)/FAD synthetase
LPFVFDARASNGRRHVDLWLPLHGWTVQQVWERIRRSGVRYHPAYDLGMPRLSCCFCIFAPRSALLLAGRHNPELLAQYVAVEKQIRHSFRLELPLASVQEALARGEEPGPVRDWAM